MTVRVNVWSSPRNVSTALMYSWRQRDDTTVVDEPLYAHYLTVSGRNHPGRDDVLRSQSTDGATVVNEVILGRHDSPIVVFKQMAKHLQGLDPHLVDDMVDHRCHNVLLTRDPREMLTSFQVNMPDATADDTGLAEMAQLLDRSLARGQEPIVVDAAALLRNPERVLRELCARLDVPFQTAMLSWPAGPKPEDGVWARHWYHRVHRSTGWESPRPSTATLLPHLEPVLAEIKPLYRRLLPYAIGFQ